MKFLILGFVLWFCLPLHLLGMTCDQAKDRYHKQGHVTAEDIQFIKSALARVRTDLTYLLDNPKQIDIKVVEDGIEFYGGPGIIKGSPRFKDRGYSSDPIHYSREQTAVFWAHEYGHAVFYEALMKEVPAVAKFVEKYRPALLDPTKWSQFQKHPEAMKFGRLAEMTMSYQELLADVIGVLYSKNPRVFYEMLEYMPDQAGWRTFVPDNPINLGDYIPSWASYSQPNSYGIFTLTRMFLGEKLVPRAIAEGKGAELIKIVMDASMAEVKMQIQGVEVKHFKPAEMKGFENYTRHGLMNHRLIESITQLAAERQF